MGPTSTEKKRLVRRSEGGEVGNSTRENLTKKSEGEME